MSGLQSSILSGTLWLYIHKVKEFLYIHNWLLQPFSQDYGLASHSTHVVCINFIHEYSLTSTPNDKFLRNLFWQFYFNLRVFARNLLREEIAEDIYFFKFPFDD